MSNAIVFVKKFPIGTVVTTNEFDQWGIDRGFIDEPKDNSKDSPEWGFLLKQRNNLRMSINKESKLFEDPSDRYSIEVYDHGESYKVFSVNDIFLKKSRSFPEQIQKSFETKANTLKTLSESSDMNRLPMAMQIEISMLSNYSEALSERVSFDLKQSQKQMDVLFDKIKRQAKILELDDGSKLTFVDSID